MSCECFTTVNFRAKTMAMIDQANEILEEYAAQGFVLTLRQLYYQFVARSFLANDDREYGRLGRAMTDARRAGLVDWDNIEDRTRELETFSSWGSPADILYGAARSYQENLWLDQLRRPEVWIEKAVFSGSNPSVYQSPLGEIHDQNLRGTLMLRREAWLVTF